MGFGDDENAPLHHHTGAGGPGGRWRWFIGSTNMGHVAVPNNPTTGRVVTNAIIAAARQSEASMRATMPGWLRDWYDAQPAERRWVIFREVAGHPDVQNPPGVPDSP